MSAFLVNRETVSFLAACAVSFHLNQYSRLRWKKPGGETIEIIPGDRAQACKIGQMLWDENLRSVSHRYPSTTSETWLEDTDMIIKKSDIKPHSVFKAVQVIETAHCLDYQSCEHDGWKTSEAKSFLTALILKITTCLPGYDDFEWGAPKTYLINK